MLLSLSRSGHFKASTMKPNAHKCAAMATKVYPYFVRIEALDTRLSPEGFLFNNERVQNYFDNRFGHKAPEWDAISCELMALTAAKELAQTLLSEGIEVQSVECCILGSNGAQITSKWTNTERSNANGSTVEAVA
jgi:hypothetical protein